MIRFFTEPRDWCLVAALTLIVLGIWGTALLMALTLGVPKP